MEDLWKKLSPDATLTGAILNEADTRQNTPSHGLTKPDGQMIIPRKVLNPEEVPAIALEMQSARRSTTPLDEQLLMKATIPTTFDNCAYWLGRLLAHFPRRDSSKDGVVISDISGELTGQRCSAVSVYEVCREFWQEATDENPFWPPSGEIINRIESRSDMYRNLFDRLVNSKVEIEHKPEPLPNWEELDSFGKFDIVRRLGFDERACKYRINNGISMSEWEQYA